MKKLVCLILAVLQVLLLTACVGENTNPTQPADPIVYAFPSEVPTYADDKEMMILAFWAPPNTEEWYQSMVDCGFTHVLIDNKYGIQPSSQALYDTLGICDQVGIKAYIMCQREDHIFATDIRYGEYESFVGAYTDEPLTKHHIDLIKQGMTNLHANFEDKHYLTTFMPWLNSTMRKDFNTYEEYVQYYMDNGGSNEEAFMFDTYPLRDNGTITDDWLVMLELLANTSKEYDVDFYSYLATMSINSQSKRRPEADDMRYTAYVNMAYGVKGFGHFCYMSPGLPPYDGEFVEDDWALVCYEDPDDWSTYYKTPTWDVVQGLNQELSAFDHVFLSFDWVGVMKSIGSDAQTSAGVNNFLAAKNWIKKHDGIKKFSSTEDALLGVFKDENGYDGFMLVNFADTYYDRENTVNIQFRGASRAMIYIGGEPQMVDLVDGTYTVTLAPGEGQFIIPLS